jgi:hypothetical protein
VVLPEPGDHAVIGHVAGAGDPEGDVHLAQPLDLPRRAHSAAVGVEQQPDQQIRIEPGPSRGRLQLPRATVERRGVDLADCVEHEPHQVIGG